MRPCGPGKLSREGRRCSVAQQRLAHLQRRQVVDAVIEVGALSGERGERQACKSQACGAPQQEQLPPVD